jgi:hypothetical protein
MLRIVDITAPWLFASLREPRQRIEAYGKTKGEIEAAVGAFAVAGGGEWKKRRAWSPSRAVVSASAVLAAMILSSGIETPYRPVVIGVATAIVAFGALVYNGMFSLPHGLASARAPGKGRLFYLGGGGLLALGFAVFLAAVLSMQAEGESPEPWPTIAAIVVGMAAAGLGALAMRHGKQLLQPTATELQAHDPRPPIVLLRSFADDKLLVVTGRANDGLKTGDFEEHIKDELELFGPFVAIGKPGEPLPALGAARNYYADADWQSAAAAWMDQALLLVVIPGLTGGLGWELDAIRRGGHLDKLLVLMPPRTSEAGQPGMIQVNWDYAFDSSGFHRLNAKQDAVDQGARWDKLRAALARADAFARLPKGQPDGLVALHLAGDGNLVLLTGPRIAWAQDYARAIRYALYGMYCHGRRAGRETSMTASGESDTRSIASSEGLS